MNRIELISALTACDKIYKKQNNQTILECVAVSDKAVEFTNLQQSVKVDIDIGCGEFCVKLKPLLNSLKAVRSEQVELSCNSSLLTISHSDGTFKLATLDRDEYPFANFKESATETLVADISNIIKVRHAQASESMNIKLCAVYLSEGKAIATDGRRLAVAGIGNDSKVSSLIPSDGVSAIVSILGDSKLDCLVIPGQQLRLKGLNDHSLPVTVLTKLVEGQYPNYKQVIPADLESEATLDAKDLKYALSAVSPALDDSSPAVRLELAHEKCKFHGESENNVSDVSVSCKSTGELKITINAKYLRDAIQHCGDYVNIKFSGADNPIMVECGDYIEIIMPIRAL